MVRKALTLAGRAAARSLFLRDQLRWLLAMRRMPASGASRQLRLGTTDAFFLDRIGRRLRHGCHHGQPNLADEISKPAMGPGTLRAVGVPGECLPGGFVRPSDPSEIEGVPVTASMVDQQAALYEHGCRAAGDAKITFVPGLRVA